MDLGTIKEKLKTLQYPDVDSFVSDVRLVFSNSDKYNLVCLSRDLVKNLKTSFTEGVVKINRKSWIAFLFQSTSDVGQAGKNLEKYFDKLFKENFSNTGKKSKVQRRRWTISFILLLSYIENNLCESNHVSVVYWIITENTNWIKIRQSEQDAVIKNRDRPHIWKIYYITYFT